MNVNFECENFDEMQLKRRGEIFKLGYFIMMIFCFAFCFLDEITSIFSTNLDLCATIVYLPTCLVTSLFIALDCYQGISKKITSNFAYFVFEIIFSLIMFCAIFLKGGIITHGQTNDNYIIFLLSVFMFTTSIVRIIKIAKVKKSKSQDTD